MCELKILLLKLCPVCVLYGVKGIGGFHSVEQGHQELSGKSDKNNSLKPNQTTPSEHCHFQRLRAKPNFLRLSRTELI